MKYITSINQKGLLSLGKEFFYTGVIQVIIQVVGFLCGILIIRNLSTGEYALYTISNTMLGTLSILADGGISVGIMALGGKVWNSPTELGTLLSTGVYLRKKFAFFSLLISLPVLCFLLRSNDVNWIMVMLVSSAVVPSFIMSLNGKVFEVVLQLHSRLFFIQSQQFILSLLRLAFLSFIFFDFGAFAFVAILASGLPQVWYTYRLKHQAQLFIRSDVAVDSGVEREIYNVVKKILPDSIFYCVTGQVLVWLTSFLGSTLLTAQVGVLSRFVMPLNIITTVFNSLVIPKFAKLSSSKSVVIWRYFVIVSLLMLLSSLIVLFSYLFSSPILSILGSKYSDLDFEFVLCIMGGCLGLVANATFALNNSRNLIISPLITIPVNTLTIIVLIGTLDVHSIQGLMLLNIFIYTVKVILNIGFFMSNIYKKESL